MKDFSCNKSAFWGFTYVQFLSLSVYFLLSGICDAKFAGGDGSAENPWQITNWIELNEIRNNATTHKNFQLMNDLDSTSVGYDLLIKKNGILADGGKGWDPIFSFAGIFDGKEHSICDFRINRTNYTNCGLFGTLADSSSVIKNLKIERSFIAGQWKVGGIVGNNEGTVFNSSFRGEISGNSYLGGITGYNSDGVISCCFSVCDITGISTVPQSIGGLIGYNSDGGIVSNSYSTSYASGYATVGGLIGYNYGSVENCYSNGGADGNMWAGVFVGYNNGGKYKNCFSLGTTEIAIGNSETKPDGIVGATINQMQSKSTFTDWDFESLWEIQAGVYPHLRTGLKITTKIIAENRRIDKPELLSASISGRSLLLSASFPSQTPFSLFNLSGREVTTGFIHGNLMTTGILSDRVYLLKIADKNAVRCIKVTTR
ncbi:MAG: GLUG motif-containing protein [Bacillota bacterium]|nr:GLUG motif-containing protein [Bacillota bacterium]